MRASASARARAGGVRMRGARIAGPRCAITAVSWAAPPQLFRQGWPEASSRACSQTLQWQCAARCAQQHSAAAADVSKGRPADCAANEKATNSATAVASRCRRRGFGRHGTPRRVLLCIFGVNAMPELPGWLLIPAGPLRGSPTGGIELEGDEVVIGMQP